MSDKNQEAIPDEMTLLLRRPIILADRTISSINLREPTAFEVEQVSKRAEKSGQGSNILLVSLVSGHTEGEIGKMGMRDFNDAMKYLQHFLGDGPETGEQS